jgi:hypothetical protein
VLANLRTIRLVILAIVLGVMLTACGGGGGGTPVTTQPVTTQPVTPAALNFNYQYTSLTASPTFGLSSVTLGSTATSGTVTLVAGTVSDVIGYQLNTTSGVLTPASPYTMAGDLRQAALMVCKPANTVEGNIFPTDVYAKAIHVGIPATAIAGSVEDLKGKTFDIYENCESTIRVVFDASANGSIFQGTSSLGGFTAASIDALLKPEGLTQIVGTETARTDTVTQYRVFKSDGKVIMLTRRFIKQPFKNVDNTSGELSAWVSR